MIERLFEAVVSLLHISIFMSYAHIVGGGVHSVVGHQGLIACGPLLALLFGQLMNRGGQMIGAMLLGNAAELPQRLLDAFGQRLKGFAEAQPHDLRVGVGEHKVVHQMREGFARDGDPQVLHRGKIGLGALAGRMDLFKDHLALWTLESSPGGDLPLEGAHLSRTVATGMALTQQRKQSGSL